MRKHSCEQCCELEYEGFCAMSQQANSGNVRPQRQSSCSAYGRKNHPISNYDCEDDGAEAPGCLCWFWVHLGR